MMAKQLAAGEALPLSFAQRGEPVEEFTRVKVQWYDDGSVRLKIYQPQMEVTKLYLKDSKGSHVLIELRPARGGE